jgi:CheY-like chemotaxis protein
MLLEDEDIVRGLTREILESAGYKVMEASRSGAADFGAIARHGPAMRARDIFWVHLHLLKTSIGPVEPKRKPNLIDSPSPLKTLRPAVNE